MDLVEISMNEAHCVLSGSNFLCTESDQELVVSLTQGDANAFGELVSRYQDRLVHFLIRMAGSRERAEDLAQESFLRLYRTLRKSQGTRQIQLLPYLFKTGINLLRTEERSKQRFQRLKNWFGIGDAAVGDQVLPGQAQAPKEPDQQLLSLELNSQIQSALVQVPLQFREPLVLREIEQWSYREIAAHLCLNEGTVKSRIYRAKELMKTQLQPYLEKGGLQ